MAEDRLSGRGRKEPVKLLYGADNAVMQWHLQQTQQNVSPDSYSAIGVTLRDKLIASVIYTRYRWPDIEIGIHSVDKRWCNRRTLRYIFGYPFIQLKCKRVTAVTDPAVPAVCIFLKRIGFVEEGRLRDVYPTGDGLILGILRGECKWIQ